MAKPETEPTDEPVAEVMSDSMLRGAGQEVERRSTQRLFDDDQLAAVTSFDEAFALLASTEHQFIDARNLGHGFALLDRDQKYKLVDQQLVIIDYRFSKSDTGAKGEFVGCFIVTKNKIDDHDRFIITDGSEGIYEQLKAIYKKAGETVVPVHAPHGLRVSEYEKVLTNPKTGVEYTQPAATFYISTDV